MTGDYITTFTGKKFPLFDPGPDDICVEDIAHHLSRICRYTGAPDYRIPNGFYSVAEHSVFVALKAPVQHRMAALLHDAAEAYIGDLARPLKYMKGMDAYRDLDTKIERVIAKKFGLEYPWNPIIKDLDNRIIVDEKQTFIKDPDWSSEDCERWGVGTEALGVQLRGWLPNDAEEAFLQTYWTLGERVRVV